VGKTRELLAKAAGCE